MAARGVGALGEEAVLHQGVELLGKGRGVGDLAGTARPADAGPEGVEVLHGDGREDEAGVRRPLAPDVLEAPRSFVEQVEAGIAAPLLGVDDAGGEQRGGCDLDEVRVAPGERVDEAPILRGEVGVRGVQDGFNLVVP